MLWGAFIWVWVVLHTERRSTDWYYVAGLAALAIAWTSFSHVIHFTANWIFEVFFGLIIFAAFVLLFAMVRRSKSPLAWKLLIAYLVFAAVAFLLWNLDQWYCSSLEVNRFVLFFLCDLIFHAFLAVPSYSFSRRGCT
jgi:hypothetical protein